MHGYTYGHAHCGNHVGAITVTMGVSNDLANTTQLGQAWANEVHQANVDFSGAQNILQVFGADDIEGAYSAVVPVQNWIAGYDSQHNIPLIDTGTADGCPPGTNMTCDAHSDRPSCRGLSTPGCSNQWAQGDYWSLGVPFQGHDQMVFPQIYCSSETAEWQAISQWGAAPNNKNRAVYFHSDLTEGGTSSSGCNQWSTSQGYAATSAFLSALNGNGQTRQGNIPYMQIVRGVG